MTDEIRPPRPAQTPPPDQPYSSGHPTRNLRSPQARPNAATRRRRSVAWIYYTILAVLALIFAINKSQPGGLLISALCSAYATYLFRGGRFVLWIW